MFCQSDDMNWPELEIYQVEAEFIIGEIFLS
jgi:hypothetical protein